MNQTLCLAPLWYLTGGDKHQTDSFSTQNDKLSFSHTDESTYFQSGLMAPSRTLWFFAQFRTSKLRCLGQLRWWYHRFWMRLHCHPQPRSHTALSKDDADKLEEIHGNTQRVINQSDECFLNLINTTVWFPFTVNFNLTWKLWILLFYLWIKDRI